MWQYQQTTGQMRDDDGNLLATGYSGAGDDKNNPSDESVKGKGPIPTGFYEIEKPAFYHLEKGILVMRLIPDFKNDMYGRDGFMIHGDSIANPGTASEGCIIMPHEARQTIAESDDCDLEVVE